MNGAGLGPEGDQLGRHGPVQLRDGDVAHAQSSATEPAGGGLDPRPDAGLNALRDATPHHPDPKSSGADPGRRRPAGEDLEQQACVGHRPGERAGVIERPPEREGALERHGAPGRFQPDAAAECRRNSDRPARIGTQGGRAHPGDHGDGRAPARAARTAPRIDRVARHPPPWIGVADAVGKFVKVGLAEDDGASLAEPCHDGGVRAGLPVAQDFGSHRGAHPARREEVLDGDRHAE